VAEPTKGRVSSPSYWPRGVLDPLCPDEHIITESLDRRVLWHLENALAVSATTDYLREKASNLRRYLNQTCEHHWHDNQQYDENDPPLRQCLWCNDVEEMAP
jgi:hypothetical protein